MKTPPQIATTPWEALNGPPRERPWLTHIAGPLVLGFIYTAGAVFTNFILRRPILSSLPYHVVGLTASAAAGKYLFDYRTNYYAERDAVFRHYMSLHPEDFPPFDRAKYADIIEPWYPIRGL